jgi:hypothetical protein
MPSSSNTNGEKFTVTEVQHLWTDNGNKMFNVWYVRENGSKWALRTWARDELDAYVAAMRKLEGAS